MVVFARPCTLEFKAATQLQIFQRKAIILWIWLDKTRNVRYVCVSWTIFVEVNLDPPLQGCVHSSIFSATLLRSTVGDQNGKHLEFTPEFKQQPLHNLQTFSQSSLPHYYDPQLDIWTENILNPLQSLSSSRYTICKPFLNLLCHIITIHSWRSEQKTSTPEF